MRRMLALLAVVAMVFIAAAPAGAAPDVLETSGIWLSDPEGDNGDAGIEQGDPVADSWGRTKVDANGATVQVYATGLEKGHTYTLWLVYFNDKTLCVDGCNGPDLAVAGAGVLWGAGRIATGDGAALFTARLNEGDGAEYVGTPPPPPFAFAAYEPGPDNEFHMVIRSHGPAIAGQVQDQLTTFGGGCTTEVGPAPAQPGDFPVPSAPGECGDVQLFVFDG